MSFSSTQIKAILITASLLMLFAVIGAALVGLTFIQTEDDIKHNEELTLLKKLNNIIPAQSYDNDLLQDIITLKANPLLGTDEESHAYRARKNKKNVAVVFSSIAPNGYNGPIDLLVGIKADGTLAGVRVVKHRETPGLGDVVSSTHSDWIFGFDGKSLSNPDPKSWKVKRDGGIFDQFTGATITPRAVVQAVHNALLYFDQNQATLFDTPPEKADLP
ncbi:MAG: electron transport complex subunit RsxG [Gammaproteobacteria bacterium]|jgi:electron transport complex protein RnfG|nr:electron transport complex subunit RsxG [Gammaproteobacteria bacterium]MCW8942795.1 electron transport complex subunit RsxG [Gammaproteobacteria bacterium]